MSYDSKSKTELIALLEQKSRELENFRERSDGSMIDITKQKESEHRLEELNRTLEERITERTRELECQRDQLRLAMDIAQMGSWEFTPDDWRLHTTDSCRKIFGMTAEQASFPMKDFLKRIHPEDLDSIQTALDNLGKKLDRREIRFRYLLSDRKQLWIHARGMPIRNEEGKIVKVVGVSRDITHEVEAQDLIQQQNASFMASSKLSALGEMAGGIAHEINNPLAVIHARSNLLKEMAEAGSASPEVVVMAADRIEKTALRISKIVRSLRIFARDGQGDPFEATPVSQILEDTLGMCNEKFKNHGAELKVEAVPSGLTVQCRAVQICQVLVNLLNNAHDAIESLPVKWVKLTVGEDADWIRITVADSGNGIPPAVEAKMMQPFFTTKQIGKGTGLGLSVSKGILEAHGGSLSLDRSAPNTTFVVTLPRNAAVQPLKNAG